MKSFEKIAQILRVDKDTIAGLESKLSAATGKKNVMDKIVEENEAMIRNRLDDLGLGRNVFAKQVYDALISKIESDNHLLFEALSRPDVTEEISCNHVLRVAKQVADSPTGFFIKKEKAIELLKNQPPRKIIQGLGYKNVNELIEKEDIFAVFSALRFLEDIDWLNNVFFKQYESLKPSDFEEREIILKTLGKNWAAVAESFTKKKYHNISHLKELGVVFVIPVMLGISGELMRMFMLALHYLNEIPFYSELFKNFAKDPEAEQARYGAGEKTFAKNLISLLRGDTIDERLSRSDKSQWLIIQRYLAKDDENDWRLFEPHLSPEALHWEKAERLLVKTGEMFNGFSINLSFWQNLNWVGDYFKTDTGIDVLVSFNLIDTSMSLVKEKELIKYLYHHQESLWNKIFIEFFGEAEMEEKIKENIIKGWFEV